MSDVVSVSTESVRLTWRGPLVSARRPFQALSPQGAALPVVLPSQDAAVGWMEETTYTVWAESLPGRTVEIRHADPVVTAALRAEREGQVVTGTVRFGSHVGLTRFVVAVDGRAEVELLAEVAPQKVSWASVDAMRAEVEAAWAGVSWAALRPTVGLHRAADGEGASPVWLALLRASMDQLDAALDEIARRPAGGIERRAERVRASRLARPDALARRSVRRHGGLTEMLDAVPARLTTDTPAHRWLASRLDHVVRRLRRLEREERQRPDSARRRVVRSEMEAIRHRVERHRARGPLADVDAPHGPATPPLSLRRRPAYAVAYDALRTLDGTLDRAEGDVRPRSLDLATLYETWCALSLVRTVADVLGVEAPVSPFGLDRSGVDVRLRRGASSAVHLSAAGAHVEIAYAPRFASPRALLAQRPDFVLTVRGQSTRRVVLDAKYRRDDEPSAVGRMGVAGLPADAIGALHRYRDAILGPDGAPGFVSDAVALFPPSSLESYASSRFWRGLAEIGVGAIPCAPGETRWLRRWTERIVSEAAAGVARA